MQPATAGIVNHIKSGFFKGIGFAAGVMATSLFAAAAAINVFSAGEVISAAKINENFAIAAPAGAIMAFDLTSCPTGWAPADGTNGTPDLRGLFIRGRDDVGSGPAGIDPGGSRPVRDVQSDAFQGHRHQVYSTNFAQPGIDYGVPSGSVSGTPWPNVGDPITDGTNGPPRFSSETRPRNMAMTYCIRKN